MCLGSLLSRDRGKAKFGGGRIIFLLVKGKRPEGSFLFSGSPGGGDTGGGETNIANRGLRISG